MGLRRVGGIIVAVWLVACGSSEPLNIVAVQTGKTLNKDHSVGAHAISFHSNDTMYVSVLSNGRGAATITWWPARTHA